LGGGGLPRDGVIFQPEKGVGVRFRYCFYLLAELVGEMEEEAKEGEEEDKVGSLSELYR